MRYRVHDDAMTSLRIIELFADPEPTPAQKQEILLRLLFVDPAGVVAATADLGGLLTSIVEQTTGLDISAGGDGRHEEPVFDWEQDEPYIRASLFAAYGRPLEEIAEELTYRDLCELIGMVPYETPMGQALHYRTGKPPKLTKHNGEQVEEWRKRARFWKLKGRGGGEGSMAGMDAKATDAFAAFKGRA